MAQQNYKWVMRSLIGCLTSVTLLSAHGEEFELESAVMDSVSGQSLGVMNEKGAMSGFFKAQKSMMYGILRSSGIDLNQLPTEVRMRLEKFQTTNLDAFKAFSQGLDLKDEGKFAEAQAFFEKAASIDPNFKLAEEMKVAMPNMNLPNLLQIQTVVRDSAKTAVDSGKRRVEVDISKATAAMMSGQNVLVGNRNSIADTSASNTAGADGFTSNPPGSGTDYAPRLAAGIAFSYTTAGASVAIASTNEWTGSQYKASGSSLESVGFGGDFVAQRGGATEAKTSSATLSDGTAVYWGSWKSAPGASASVIVSGVPLSSPTLGTDVFYMMGDATRTMPTAGTATFAPAGGFLANVAGNISVNFVTREVALNNLGFTLGGLSFAQLNGTSSYDAGIASGFFKGNYNSGTCVGCVAFTPGASAFTGNFVGTAANGAILSTILQNGAGTVAGVHLFSR